MATAASLSNRFLSFQYTPTLISSLFTHNLRPLMHIQNIATFPRVPNNFRSDLFQFGDKFDDRSRYSGWNFMKGRVPFGKRDKYVPLMLFREVVWPNLLKNLKTVMFTNVLVRRFIDPKFRKKDFLDEAKLMVLQVSKLLAQGDIDSLRGVLTDDAIRELRPNLIKMSRKQRQGLAVDPEKIIFGFIYSLDVRVDKTAIPQKRFVEITCCFHTFNEEGDVAGEASYLPMRKIFENKEKHTICNYRFIRDYTKGVNGRWMVNRLNHFKPSDIPRRYRRIKLTS